MPDWLTFPAVLLTLVTGLVLLLSVDWRLSIGALIVQFIAVFILAAANWPVELAITKLIAGWMAGAVLGMALLSLPDSSPDGGEPPIFTRAQALGSGDWAPGAYAFSGQVFRVLAAGLVLLTAFSMAPLLTAWEPQIDLTTARGGLVLIGLGLLQLGFTSRTMRTSLGLLTALSGFEVLYSAIESSTLVAGLLAGVTLGLALTGAYLLIAPQMEEAE